MKKLLSVLALMLVLAMTFSMTVSAGPDGIIENPEITVHYISPTIDGNIVSNEGWSTAALMNANTLGYFWAHNPLTSDDNIFYAVDAEGISVAGKVVEGLSAIDMSGIDVTGMNQFNYSTGEDNIDPNAETGAKDYGWNGDVMGLMFDPLGALIAEGFAGQADYSAWYLVGLFEGDVAKIYRSHTPNNEKNGDITAKAGVQAAGKKLDDGWCFEIKLPWDMILSDINDASMGYVNLTKEDVLKNGNTIRAGALYQDRFFDEEQGSVQTWGRYITAPTSLPDGTPGHVGTGEAIQSYGINLVLADVPETVNEETDETTTGPNGETAAPKPGETSKITTKNPATTNSQNKGNATGGSSAQTFDMTIALAVGAFAVSGIGVVASVATKKRK